MSAILTINPKYLTAMINKGVVYYDLKNYDEAIVSTTLS
jgi:hypothetical protein